LSVSRFHALAAAAVLSMAVVAGQPTAAAASGPGEVTGASSAQLPAIDLDSGSRFPERGARGQILVVNFWASWCGPCRKELPSLERLAAHRRDITVIAASVDADHGDAVKAFAGLYPHLRLGFSSFAEVRRYGALGTPYSVLFDRTGREVARVPRAIDWSGAQTGALLKRAG
jgi:thiol-disulfide isomerase/thioredoxin